ncbi:NAD(P)H oxidoreductase [Bacillus horti]|uniref:NADPH-quinone reductase n=1 Tax=Caldalkalibacillus horti TaxID=77523 RepID=A0ABT9VXI6_9BACI|nr:NAD(P)H oxidoreductase [Bacillus horti]MDQ0165589.1 putative NADPH-quinone reductase [Bacillus horti]
MKVLTVVTHPRRDSLTFAVAKRFEQGLLDAGHEVEVLDLYRSGFNPALHELDEPDWSASIQQFSSEVDDEIKRMEKHDALAFIFPLWWWNMPAMLKGYIDRVWNYGVAYGPKKLSHQQVLWLSLVGAPKEKLEKRKYDQMIQHYFNVGIADYCGIKHSKVEFLFETIKDKSTEYMEDLLDQAYDLGLNYEIKKASI